MVKPSKSKLMFTQLDSTSNHVNKGYSVKTCTEKCKVLHLEIIETQQGCMLSNCNMTLH
jgi:hypothetical protein